MNVVGSILLTYYYLIIDLFWFWFLHFTILEEVGRPFISTVWTGTFNMTEYSHTLFSVAANTVNLLQTLPKKQIFNDIRNTGKLFPEKKDLYWLTIMSTFNCYIFRPQ